MNKIAEFIKQKRKEARLTQEEFAIRSGLGLRFVRELEQGKATVRMDKVNQALAMFGMEAVPGRKGYTNVQAEVPKAEMSDYPIALRASTQGRGSFTFYFERYEEVPANVAQKIIADAQKEQA